MPCLLDIPTELRYLIFKEVIHDRRGPPTAPSRIGRGEFQIVNYSAWCNGRYKIYDEKPGTLCPSNSFGLLLTNRRISEETKALLNGETDYHLDISVLNEVDLYPTWLYIPRTTNRISTLRVDVRTFGHIIDEDDARYSCIVNRIGIECSIYSLLKRIFQHGTNVQNYQHFQQKLGSGDAGLPEHEGKTRDESNEVHETREITVKALDIHFQSAEKELDFPPEGGFWLWQRRHAWLVEMRYNEVVELERYTTPPEWLAIHVKVELDRILSNIDQFQWKKGHGRIVYERIGTIRFFVNDELWETIDTAARMAEMRPMRIVPFDRLDEVELEWKRMATTKRELAGLPVVKPGDP